MRLFLLFILLTLPILHVVGYAQSPVYNSSNRTLNQLNSITINTSPDVSRKTIHYKQETKNNYVDFFEYRRSFLSAPSEGTVFPLTTISNTTIIEDTTVTFSENVTVESGGILIIRNATVLFSSDFDMRCIRVLAGGNLTIIDSILKPDDYFSLYCIIAEAGSSIIIKHSKILSGGYYLTSAVNIYTDNATIIDNIFDGCSGNIKVSGASNVYIADNTFKLSYDPHIRIINSRNLTFTNNMITCREVSGYSSITIVSDGILIKESNNIEIASSEFAFCSYAIYLNETTDITISNVNITNSNIAIGIYNSQNIGISNSQTAENDKGIHIENSEVITISNVSLVDDGIWLDNMNSTQIGTLKISNVTTNNKPITILNGESSVRLGDTYGQILLFYSQDITISGVADGVEIYRSSNIKLEGSYGNNDYGILSIDSKNINATNAQFYNTDQGLYFKNSSRVTINYTTTNTADLIYANNCSYVAITNVNMSNGGVTIENSENVYITQVMSGIKISITSSKNISISQSSLEAIALYSSSEFNLTLNEIDNNKYGSGIYISGSQNGTIISNLINDTDEGIEAYSSNNILIIDNSVSNSNYGLYLSYLENSTIANNTISNNDYGIRIYTSNNLTINNNNLIDDLMLIDSESHNLTIQDNTVNGMPIIALNQESNISITNRNLGELIVINSNNISFSNGTIGGILIVDSSNIRISYAYISKCDFGAYLDGAENVSLIFIDLEEADNYGLYITSSQNIAIKNSTIIRNRGDGIRIYDSSGISILYSNIFSNSDFGLFLSADTTVNATYNYWGSPTGPSNTIFADSSDPEEVYAFYGSIITRPYLSSLAYSYDAVPPSITFEYEPLAPLENESVSISGTVSDNLNVTKVILYYSIDNNNWYTINVSIELGNYIYAEIPGQKRGTTVYFYLEASDFYGNVVKTQTYNYTVIDDNTPPTISSISISPEQPHENETITIVAKITDNVGIKVVYLYYKINNGSWTTIEMSPTGNIFTAHIPGQKAGTQITFYILAIDLYGNQAQSQTMNITIKAPEGGIIGGGAGWQSTNWILILISTAIIVAVVATGFIMLKKRKH